MTTECSAPSSESECAFSFECGVIGSECAPALFTEPAPGMVSLFELSAATCILEALRDGAEGEYSWRVNTATPGVHRNVFVIVRPDRAALRTTTAWFDISNETFLLGPAPLQGAAYFESCAMLTEPAALLDCLRGAVVVDGCPE